MYRLVEVISDVGMVWDDLAVVLESEVKTQENINISPAFNKLHHAYQSQSAVPCSCQ